MKTDVMHMMPTAHRRLLDRAIGLREFQHQAQSPRNAFEARPKEDYFGTPLPRPELVERVAVVRMCGPLVKGATGFDKWWYGCMSHEDLREDLNWAAGVVASGQAKGILIRTDCPGGTHVGCIELARRVAELSERVLVLEFVEDVRASAAEFITAAATGRFCTASAITGCIGSLIELPILAKYYEEMGVEWKQFASGKYKGAGSPRVPMQEAHAEMFQAMVDEASGQFEEWMARHRGTLAEDMQGQVFSGEVSVERNLSDGVVRGLDEVLGYF